MSIFKEWTKLVSCSSRLFQWTCFLSSLLPSPTSYSHYKTMCLWCHEHRIIIYLLSQEIVEYLSWKSEVEKDIAVLGLFSFAFWKDCLFLFCFLRGGTIEYDITRWLFLVIFRTMLSAVEDQEKWQFCLEELTIEFRGKAIERSGHLCCTSIYIPDKILKCEILLSFSWYKL